MAQSDLPYPFTVRPLAADEGGGYLIEFPNLPGCMADGETVEEALREGADALRSWVATMRELDRLVAPGKAESASTQSLETGAAVRGV